MVVTAEWSDGNEEVVADYTYSPSGALTTDDTEVVVSYGGKTASVSITVNAIDLEVEALTDTSVDLFGKDVDDLQENIVVGTNAITGTLKYVADYSSAFSGDEASGNYIAIKSTAISGAVLTAEVVNGVHGEVTLDSDGILVARIANNNQSIRITATIDGQSETKTFALTDLVLTPEQA